MLKVTRLESAMLPYCVFISKILIHFGVDCVDESSETYNRNNLIYKSALHKMGMQHTPEGWVFKVEATKEDEEVEGSSSIPYRTKWEFERTILREMKSLKIMCQKTRDDIAKIKEHLNLENQNFKRL
ncbi:hypothetical protein LR48_Vigan09g053500 [Vigna angularis]|uniref:Uncharacterized protein n=1 Tax=Phaseolus angularis TaxID=3914 RepID=A0A0L9V9W8_PHAAN|nr:hypothetical protein LR48_Vigan09g053500 [Vigna angularis]